MARQQQRDITKKIIPGKPENKPGKIHKNAPLPMQNSKREKPGSPMLFSTLYSDS